MKPCCCGHQGAPWCLGLSWGAQEAASGTHRPLVCLVEETGPERGWVSLSAPRPPPPDTLATGQGQPAAASLTVAHSATGVRLGRLLLSVGRSGRLLPRGTWPLWPSSQDAFCGPRCPVLRGARLLLHLPWRRALAPALPQAPVYPQGFPLGWVGGQEGCPGEQESRILRRNPCWHVDPSRAAHCAVWGPMA